ncbi:3'-5' exonuclease domain-containing protein 2 [Massilia arenosa]|uniref:3'-5' exonuclease domain-containing protein 2 n=1 Tax=Zemynaea arenosa TaxID=2561931 RepID=A0A4Y9SQ15_9BURK|nr:3'-5' exonuclease [Massilia arenosa]TFW27439.1 3'-5' exonuclease domain-containing protein 2 [Massilia arenosa]
MQTQPGEADAPEELLPPYPGLDLSRVLLVRTAPDAAAALAALMAADAVGFDTESKPTFVKGEKSTGPHLVQLATDTHAYLFQYGAGAGADAPFVGVIKAVLESPLVLKAGFGLADDIKRLKVKFGIEMANVVDLANVLRERGQRNPVGARTAVARYFGQALKKSKKITTTNWAVPRLSEQQILYAADDAHVALRIYRHWHALRTAPLV